MRLGRNDKKVHDPLNPARITAVVVTYVPEETGYFQDRLEVIRLSLESLVKHADLPIDLMVFDNASCKSAVRLLEKLKEQGLIQYLVLSAQNVGLAGAYRIISSAAPGEIIAFANDDVFYLPGWLSPQVEILDKLSDVGLVSGFYLRATHPRTSELAAEKGLTVCEVPAPEEWLQEFCRDASYENPDAYYQAQVVQGWTDLRDIVVSRNDIKAYAGGVCWQAVYKKETMKSVLPQGHPKEHGWNSYDGYFHSEIIRCGYLRLSTTERYVRHIGNVLTPDIKSLAGQYGLLTKARVVTQKAVHRWRWLMTFWRVRKSVEWLYNFTYRLLNM
jgi:hypothetical protein